MKTRMTQIRTDPRHPRQSATKADQKNNEYSSRFGEPVPTPLRTLVVALLTIALRTVDDEAPGLNCL